jgi:hypothetical protein
VLYTYTNVFFVFQPKFDSANAADYASRPHPHAVHTWVPYLYTGHVPHATRIEDCSTSGRVDRSSSRRLQCLSSTMTTPLLTATTSPAVCSVLHILDGNMKKLLSRDWRGDISPSCIDRFVARVCHKPYVYSANRSHRPRLTKSSSVHSLNSELCLC